jgi:colanic acid/amylovoran biosynthesis glycosyltransferase
VASLFPTVSETFVLNHITGLIDMGYEVDIYAFGAEKLDYYGHAQLEEYHLEAHITYIDSELGSDEISNRFLARKYCAVHCHFGQVSEKLAFLKAELPAVPFLVTFHGLDMRLARSEGRQVLESTFEHFDWFVSICAHNRTSLEQLGCPTEQIIDIPNGVDTSHFVPTARTHERPPRFITVARLHRSKNIPLALRALHTLKQSGVDFTYDLVGHGPELSRLKTLIEVLDLGSQVTLHGQRSQNEVAKALSDSDIFLLPSRAEASPVCVLEALASELPVIATDVGGMSELIDDGVNGFIVNPNNEKEYAQKIADLAHNAQKRRLMGQLGRQWVEKYRDAGALLRQCASYYARKPAPIV